MASNAVNLLRNVSKQNCLLHFYFKPIYPMFVSTLHTFDTSHSRKLCSMTTTPSSSVEFSKSHSNFKVWTQRIKKYESIEEVLNITQKENINGNQASVALNIIKNCYQKDKHNGVKHRFRANYLEHLYTELTKDVTKLSGESIVTSICNVFKLDHTTCTCRSQDIVKMLEPECRRRLHSLSAYQLSVLLCHYQLLLSNEETNALVKEAARAMEFRWKEIQNPQVVRRLLCSAKYFSASLMNCLEDKAVEVMNHLSFEEIVQLSKSLSNNNLRSLPILRAISFQSIEKRKEWELYMMLELLKSLSKLNFHHDSLYKEMARYMKKQLPNCNCSTVCHVALSYALLRVHNSDLLDAIATYIAQVRNLELIAVDDLSHLLFAFSQLCYMIQDFQSLTDKVADKLQVDSKEVSPQVQIDIAFSLAVLQKCPHNLLSQVLMDTQFFTKNMFDSCMSREKKAVYQLKLLQLNSYAQLECKGYHGPYLSHLDFPEAFKVNSTKLHDSVVKTLEAVTGGPKFCMTNVRLSAGYQLDAVVLLKEDATPLSISAYHKTTDSNFNIIPESEIYHTRVAIVTWGPSNYMFGRKQLIGRSLMAKRHLHLLGFHLVEVPFHKWSSLKSDWERLSFIKHKMTIATTHRA